MISCADQFPRPAAIPVPLNRQPPVGQPQLFTLPAFVTPLPVSAPPHAFYAPPPPLPGFVLPPQGIPVHGPGPNPPSRTTLIIPISVSRVPIQQPPHQFAGDIPPVTEHQAFGGGFHPQAPTHPQPVAGSVPAGQANGTGGHPAPLPSRQPPGFLDNCLNCIRCCNAMEDCYRLNGSCCTGGCWDEGGCAGVSGCFSGLFSFLDSPPQ